MLSKVENNRDYLYEVYTDIGNLPIHIPLKIDVGFQFSCLDKLRYFFVRDDYSDIVEQTLFYLARKTVCKHFNAPFHSGSICFVSNPPILSFCLGGAGRIEVEGKLKAESRPIYDYLRECAIKETLLFECLVIEITEVRVR